MKFRNVELYYQLSLDDTGTKIIDLKTTDPISAIRLDFEATNGATSNKSNFINDIITKIEMVDGSDQLLSLNCKQAQALQFFNTKKTPYMRPGESGGGTQNEQVLLMFGRHLWDLEYYLDLKKFNNPQLKITTDEDAVRAISATGYATGTFKVTITLHVIEEGAPEAKGFMMQKEIYSFTSAASGDEHVDLPLDYPYAGLLVRAHLAGYDIDELLSNLKISCDAGKFVPIDKKIKKVYQMNEEDFGVAEMRYFLYRADNETVYHPINHDPIVSVMGRDASDVINVNTCWSGSFILRFYDASGGAVSTAELLPFMVRGGALHATIIVPFGILERPDTYFDPKQYDDIDLILTQATASGVCQVFLQQLRTYGAK